MEQINTTDGWIIFKDFENKKFIHEDQFDTLVKYICGNIISDYSPNRSYFEEMYNYFSKLCIVARWRKKKVRNQ